MFRKLFDNFNCGIIVLNGIDDEKLKLIEKDLSLEEKVKNEIGL